MHSRHGIGHGSCVALLAVLVLPAASYLVVGGEFPTAGGVTVHNVALWDSASWSAFGSGIVNTSVEAFADYNGMLTASGGLIRGYGYPIYDYYVAQWTGMEWLPVSSTINNYINCTVVYDGRLVVGGAFTSPFEYIAQWDGAAWSGVGDVNEAVYDLAVYNGKLVAGGYFDTASGVIVNYVAQWSGSSWSSLGSGLEAVVFSLVVYDGSLIAGGACAAVGGVRAGCVARWDGTFWSALGSGMSSSVLTLAIYNGNLVAGGHFQNASDVRVDRVAQWNGANWSPLGSGVNDGVFVLTQFDGDLVAGGEFTSAGGVAVNRVAKWNGVAWSALGAGTTGVVRALAVVSSGKRTPPPPGGCSLATVGWHAQYFTADDILVGDDLAFAQDGNFVQTTTAFSFQPCEPNWVDWTGGYEHTSSTDVLLTYASCTPSGLGCLSCWTTSAEWASVSFSSDCETLTLKHEDGVARTYIPAKTKQLLAP